MVLKEFSDEFVKHWGKDYIHDYMVNLIKREITDAEALEMHKSNTVFYKSTHDVKWMQKKIEYLIRQCVKKVMNVRFENGYVYIDKIPPKEKKFSTRQLYKKEVMEKITEGRKDFDNTNIELSNRDKNSILRELGLEVPISKTNFEKNHINWNGVEDLFNNILTKDWTRARVVRSIRRFLKHDVSISTLEYKEREYGEFIPRMEEYDFYLMFKREELVHSREYVLSKYDLIEDSEDMEYLFNNYSFSEIAYIHNLPLYKVVSLSKGFSHKRKGFPYLNNANTNKTYYKIDIELVDKELDLYDNEYFIEKYGIGYSTVNTLRREKGIYCSDSHKKLFKSNDLNELKIELEDVKTKEWFDYYRDYILSTYVDKVEKLTKIINKSNKNVELFREDMLKLYKQKGMECKDMWLRGYAQYDICQKLNITSREFDILIPNKNSLRKDLKAFLLSKGTYMCFSCHTIRDLSHFHMSEDKVTPRTSCKDCKRETKWKGSTTSKQLQEMYTYFEYKCAYCGKELNGKLIAVDHIHPTVKGGEDIISNLVISCLPCNSVFKADKELDELSFNEKFTEERKNKILKWIEISSKK
ncbi:MAG: HNH endonuclease [Cetobacterium sp.]